MLQLKSICRVGVHVDAHSVIGSGGRRTGYDVLRESACRDGSELVRLNAYVSCDAERVWVNADQSLESQLTASSLVEGGCEACVIEFVSCLPGRI